MRSSMILITALLISSCATRPSLVDGCFSDQTPPQTISVPAVNIATANDYRLAAITRTKELLISLKQYKSARKCVGVFE